MNEPNTRTLEAPGAVLHYDVRPAEASDHPVLLAIGSPMAAEGFAALASRFTDRTVVTYDPRGAGRSPRTDGALVTRVEEHADDLHRIIAALDAGPVDVFASSGGAVNALALTATHPEQVRVLIAHEPPAFRVLPDSGPLLTAAEDMHETYLKSGFGPAMAKFIALAGHHRGPVTAEYAERPAPDPAAFGLPTEDDGTRDDPLLGLNMPSVVAYEHDFAALKAASASGRTRIVIGVGQESSDMVAGRAAIAVAARLGIEPVTFPGGHAAFADKDFAGPDSRPDDFAAVLRSVLS
ncbi:MAG: alpha/beta fold hydrolase [Nocardiopsaceae bacterium]|nr:alpha/beta fold hydrolase [Nocardiopsaceae bacterium]